MTNAQKVLEDAAKAFRESPSNCDPILAALRVAIEAAAKVARDHKGAAKRKRAENQGLKNSMRFASDEAKAEIWAEERGEDIAAEIIERSILSLIPKETT
jgi:cell division septum initiation protein DivIVA